MTDKPQQYPKMTYEQLEESHAEWKKTAMDNYDWAKYEEKRASAAESLIQQKDAEIAAAEKAYEGLQANCVSRGEYEATLKKLDDMTKAYHALLQDKGDTP